MNRLSVLFVVLAGLLIVGCGQAAPPPTPTKAPATPTTAPAAPTKAAEPTKAPAAPTKAAAPQPTAAPAKKVEYPTGSISFIVPWATGGSADYQARVLAAALEKEFKVPVQVLNRPGAGSQVGLTEIARAKPDGHTIGWFASPSGLGTYLDPDKKATYTRKDFQPLALIGAEPEVIAVRAESPLKSLKDLVDAAKANPGKVTVGTTGVMGEAHQSLLMFEKLAGVKFGLVHFGGGAGEQIPQLLGGHVEAGTATSASYAPPYKNGQVRFLGIMDREESKFFPGVKTFRSQGYNLDFASSKGIIAPAGTPREIVEILSAAIKKALADPEVKQKYDEGTMPVIYLDPAQYGTYWSEREAETKSLLEEAKSQGK